MDEVRHEFKVHGTEQNMRDRASDANRLPVEQMQKQLVDRSPPSGAFKYTKLGGLGANVGGDRWIEKTRLYRKMKSVVCRIQSTNTLVSQHRQEKKRFREQWKQAEAVRHAAKWDAKPEFNSDDIPVKMTYRALGLDVKRPRQAIMKSWTIIQSSSSQPMLMNNRE